MDKKNNREELLRVLNEGDAQEFANLWQCSENDEYYHQYEVEGFAQKQTWDDGTVHTYDAVYSLNDGKISDELRAFLNENGYIVNSLVFVKTDEYTNKEQVFFMYYNGSNGTENNALNPMKDAVRFLESLQEKTSWATLLGTICDTADDVYSWYFTFEP